MDCGIHIVVPLVGTWIETEYADEIALYREVVPLVGTWIETKIRVNRPMSWQGRSPRGNVD